MPTTQLLPGGGLKDFVMKKEKITGAITGGVAALAIGTLLYKVLPFVNKLLGMAVDTVGQAIVLGGEIFVAVILFLILTNHKTWEFIGWFGKLWARKITSLLARINPVDRVQAFATEVLQERVLFIRSKIAIIEGNRSKIDAEYAKNSDDLQKARERANAVRARSYDEKNKVWHSDEDKDLFSHLAQTVATLEGVTTKQKKQLERTDMYLKLLHKVERFFDYKVQGIREYVKALVSEYQTTQALSDSTEAVDSTLSGTHLEDQICQAAAEHMENDIAMSIGKVETFMATYESALREMDLDNEIAEGKLMEQLQGVNAEADSLLSGAETVGTAISSGDKDAIRKALPAPNPLSTPAKLAPSQERYTGLLRRSQ